MCACIADCRSKGTRGITEIFISQFSTSPELLWRLTRAYFHKSLFHKGREEGEDEKRYLSQGKQ